MDAGAIAAGVGAIVTATGGVILVVHEFRRRDRKQSAREIEEMSADLHHCRSVLLTWRRYAYVLRERLVDHGHDPPDPPGEQM